MEKEMAEMMNHVQVSKEEDSHSHCHDSQTHKHKSDNYQFKHHEEHQYESVDHQHEQEHKHNEEHKHSMKPHGCAGKCKINLWEESHGPHQVYYRAEIKSISNISNVDQSFDVMMDIILEWMASKKDEKLVNIIVDNKKDQKLSIQSKDLLKNLKNNESFIPPDIDFQHLIQNIAAPTSKIEVMKIDEMLCFRQTTSYHLKFSERFELQSFPFDCQDFTIRMIFPVCNKIAHFFPSVTQSDQTFIRLQPQYHLSEWRMHAPLCEQRKVPRNVIDSDFQQKVLNETSIIISLKAQRNWKSYCFRIFVVTFLISLTLLGAYTLDAEEVGDRLQHGVTILLTMVAFQFVVQTHLPHLGYLTVLDKYLLWMDAYVVLSILLMALPHLLQKQHDINIDVVNMICGWVTIGFIVSINIYIIVLVTRWYYPNEIKKLTATRYELKKLNGSIYDALQETVMNKFVYDDVCGGGGMIYYGDETTLAKKLKDDAETVDIKYLHQLSEYMNWAGIWCTKGDRACAEYVYIFVKRNGVNDDGIDDAHSTTHTHVHTHTHKHKHTHKDDDHHHTHKLILVARKITGDAHVLSGEIAWKLSGVPKWKINEEKPEKLTGLMQSDLKWINIEMVAKAQNTLILESHNANESKKEYVRLTFESKEQYIKT